MPRHRLSTISGSIRHASYGVELVTNGGFDSDTANWSAGNNAILASVAGGQSGNYMSITDADASNPLAYQAIAVTSGTLYRIIVYRKQASGASTHRILAAIAGGSSWQYDWTTAPDSWTESNYNILADASANLTINLYNIGLPAARAMGFDSISLSAVTLGLG